MNPAYGPWGAFPYHRPPTLPKWQGVPLSTVGFDGAPTLETVNGYVNERVRYVPESRDRWQPADETLIMGVGDCEDYAIAKMDLLISGGFPADQLFLVIGQDQERGNPGEFFDVGSHALLLAFEGNGAFHLCNRTNTLILAETNHLFRPEYGHCRDGSNWMFGVQK